MLQWGGLFVAYLLWKLVLRGMVFRTVLVQWTLRHESEEHGNFSKEKLPFTLGRQPKATVMAKNVSEICGQL